MKKETKKAPTIRFRGFTNDWEQRKLSEYLVTSTDKNHVGRFSRADVLSVSGELGIINQIEFQGRSFAGASVLNYGIVKTNDIVYTKSPLKVNPYGIIKANAGKSGIVSTLYAIYHPKKNTDSKFIECYFDSNDRLNHYLRPLVNKGAKNDMKVMNKDVLKGKVDFPPTMKEQRIIASFITEIEMTTALYQRKLDQLKKLKKYFLQNMFPAKGEKVPRIRFKGFTGDWEQRKLGELGTLKNGMNFSKEAMGKGYPFVNLQNIFGNNVIDISKLGLAMASSTQLKEYSLQKGDVLFVRSSVKLEGVGEAALVSENLENTTYSGFIIRFHDQAGMDDNFKRFIFRTSSVRQQIMSQATDSANKNISQQVLSNIKIMIPEKAEQEIVGQYFSNLFTLITLHQRKLDQLQTMKKFMLQNLFI